MVGVGNVAEGGAKLSEERVGAREGKLAQGEVNQIVSGSALQQA